MAARIKRHRSERPKNWVTYEEPRRLARLAGTLPAGHDFIIIDCLTLFVSNMMHAKESPEIIEKETISAIAALKKRKGCSAIVSNEVGLGIVPDTKLGRKFRDIAGRINKIAAERSDRMVFMISGIPLRIK